MNQKTTASAECPLRLSKGSATIILLIGLIGLIVDSRDTMLFLRALPIVMLVLGPLVVYLHVAPRAARQPVRVRVRNR